jgi:hypothetical protein
MRGNFSSSVQECSTGQVDAAVPSRGTNEPFWTVHDLDIIDSTAASISLAALLLLRDGTSADAVSWTS